MMRVRRALMASPACRGAAAAVLNLNFITETYTGATPTCTRAQDVSSYALTTAGVWTPFAADTLRRTNKGLLVEPAATNLVRRGTAISNAATWTHTATTASADATTDPRGGSEADNFAETGGTALVVNSTGFTVSTATTYTFSAHAKVNDITWQRWRLAESTGFSDTLTVWFDIANGTEGTNSNGTDMTISAASIEALTNSWKRPQISFQSAADTTIHIGWCSASADNATTRADIGGGAGVGGDYWLDCCQLELGSVASSPIPLASTSDVTRNADQVDFTIPVGITSLRYTFDDDSTQDVGVSAGAYTVPTNLNRRIIETIVGS
jgi:hypothetical protein